MKSGGPNKSQQEAKHHQTPSPVQKHITNFIPPTKYNITCCINVGRAALGWKVTTVLWLLHIQQVLLLRIGDQWFIIRHSFTSVFRSGSLLRCGKGRKFDKLLFTVMWNIIFSDPDTFHEMFLYLCRSTVSCKYQREMKLLLFIIGYSAVWPTWDPVGLNVAPELKWPSLIYAHKSASEFQF